MTSIALLATALPAARHRPRYVQIADTLREQIATAELARGIRLPSEAALARQHGCCRVTVRESLALLVREGLVVSQRGKGSFVSGARGVHELSSPVGFHDAMRSTGHAARSQVSTVRRLAARKDIAAALRVPVRTPLVEIQRLRLLDGLAVATQTIYVTEAVGDRLLGADMTGDLQPMLEQVTQRLIGRAEIKVDAVACPSALAATLSLTAGAPMLRLARTLYSEQDEPLSHESVMSRGDSFELKMDVARGRRRYTDVSTNHTNQA